MRGRLCSCAAKPNYHLGTTPQSLSRRPPSTGPRRPTAAVTYFRWAKVRPDALCWWCKCPSQTRDHLFKVCPEWKVQQKVLWVEVQKETGRWKSRWKIRDLLADKRCRKAVLDFLTATDVGRLVPPVEEDGAGARRQNGSSESGRSGKRNRRRRQRSWVLRKARAPERNYRCSYPRRPSWHRQARSRETGCAFLYFFPFVKFLGRVYFYSWDRPGRRAKGSLQRAATADRKTGQNLRRHDLYRPNASTIKQIKYRCRNGRRAEARRRR